MPATEMVVTIGVATAVMLTLISLIRLAAMAITHRTIRRAMVDNPDAAEPLLAQLAAPKGNDGDARLETPNAVGRDTGNGEVDHGGE